MDITILNEARGFIYSDIEREINLAKQNKDAGNFLCALGLVSYTEFAGGVARNTFARGQSRRNFEHFFNLLGSDYRSFGQQHDVYEIFRCGLVHEYYAKHNCTIYMKKGSETIGIGQEDNGSYYFSVETYFEDFKRAFNTL